MKVSWLTLSVTCAILVLILPEVTPAGTGRGSSGGFVEDFFEWLLDLVPCWLDSGGRKYKRPKCHQKPKKPFVLKHPKMKSNSTLKTWSFVNASDRIGPNNYGFYGRGDFENQYYGSIPATLGIFNRATKSDGFDPTLEKAGFLGGPDAALSLMEVYHRYIIYRSLQNFVKHGPGHNDDNVFQNYDPTTSSFDKSTVECKPKCPWHSAFCDAGICRCKNGQDAMFGQCWAALKDFLGEYRQSSKYQARSSYREEGKVCSHDRDCTRYDMNLYCQRDVKPGRKIWEAGAEERARLREEKRENTDYEKLLEELERNPRKRGREWMRSIAADYYEPNDWHQCRCRKGMKWNPLTAECQIYLDVNCPRIQRNAMTVHDNNVNDRSDTTVHYWKYLDDQYQDYSRLSTERKTRPGYVCISKLKPSDTTQHSALLKIDSNSVTGNEITKIFCDEVNSLSKEYEARHRRAITNGAIKQSPMITFLILLSSRILTT